MCESSWAAVSPWVGSMRMSSGASTRKENPRLDSSSWCDETPKSMSTPTPDRRRQTRHDAQAPRQGRRTSASTMSTRLARLTRPRRPQFEHQDRGRCPTGAAAGRPAIWRPRDRRRPTWRQQAHRCPVRRTARQFHLRALVRGSCPGHLQPFNRQDARGGRRRGPLAS